VRQLARAFGGGGEILRVDLIASLGGPEPHDAIVIRGRPPITARIDGGIPSHVATAALIVRSLTAVAVASAGLVSAADVLDPYAGRTEPPLT
jgi:hypothetical protein